MPARHCARSAHLVGTLVRARSAPPRLPPPSSPGCPTYGSRQEKNRGGTLGLNHMHMTCKTVRKTVQAVPRVMQKTSCSTCHAKNKLFHVSCKKAVPHVMQKKQAVPHVMQKNKLFHMSCKNHAKTMQNAVRTERQPAEPALFPGSLLYVLYVLYLTRQATEHPLFPGSLLYVLYMLYLTRQATEHLLSPGSLLYVLYLTRQATEHPLSPGSLLYVLYALYLTRQATEHPLSPGSLLYVLYVQ